MHECQFGFVTSMMISFRVLRQLSGMLQGRIWKILKGCDTFEDNDNKYREQSS